MGINSAVKGLLSKQKALGLVPLCPAPKINKKQNHNKKCLVLAFM